MTVASQAALLVRARRHFAGRRLAEARADFEAALGMGPAVAADYNDFGRVLNNLRDYDAAREAFVSAAALDPGFADAHNNLGHVLRALNKAEEAAACFRRAVTLRPDYVKAWVNLGTVLALIGNYTEAIDAVKKAIALEPGVADAHLNLAGLYRVVDAPEKAQAHIRQAIALAPDLADARIQLASLLESLGEIEQSAQCYEEALKLEPLNPDALAGMADVMDKSGQYEAALEMLEPGLAQHPNEPALAVARARLLRRVGRIDEALATLAAARTANPDAAQRLPRYFFTLGEIYDARGEFDAAFDSYQRANALKQEPFEPADMVAAVDALVGVFTPEFVTAAPISGCDSERPVFIIGMPRSGTSLVEQILASHPDVHGAGELRLLSDMVRRTGAAHGSPYPDCLRAFSGEQFAELADEYLRGLKALNTDAPRVTDKMPHNFLHSGLIFKLFPNAHVLHCVRHPLDTILSCYFQDFASSGMAFSNNLEHLALYYRQYERLMTHWRRVFPGRFIEVRYEDLVENTEQHARRMLAGVGLGWDEAVLKFHQHRRLVKTASHAQVRQPIYKRSLARHEHYAAHLGNVCATLRELLPKADI